MTSASSSRYHTHSTMGDFLRTHFAILAAFALPLIVIGVLLATTYLPGALLTTDYDFVYAACADGTNSYSYDCNSYMQRLVTVEDGRITFNEISPEVDTDEDGIPDVDEGHPVRLFFHDTGKNESREILLEDAQALSVSGLLTSPDGVTVSSSYNRNADFFLVFDGGSSYGIYLTKGKSKNRLNLINDSDRYYYRNNFHFVGWVVPS